MAESVRVPAVVAVMRDSCCAAPTGAPRESAIVLGTFVDLSGWELDAPLAGDGFLLRSLERGGQRHIVIAGASDRGVLYGAFTLLRKIALGEPVGNLDVAEQPHAPVRWVNHWDNLDGTVGRGYGGGSIFWEGPRPQ